MGDVVDNLILDLLEWLALGPRPYAEVLESWRTSCPRLPIWEEANSRGLVICSSSHGEGRSVAITNAGVEYLTSSRVRRMPVDASQ